VNIASMHRVIPAAATLLLAGLSACASAPGMTGGGIGPEPIVSGTAPSPDPRVGLSAGRYDAGAAAWNMRLIGTAPRPDHLGMDETNSDLAFQGNHVFQGNYNGYQVWDVSDPRNPTLAHVVPCRASQSDVSVYRNLLFVSAEAASARLDCGPQGVEAAVSTERIRGVRIFDITDVRNPRYVANVQTCRGSHTHTVVTDPNDSENVYIYISGSSRVRSPEELPRCSDLAPDEDPNSIRFRIEVIQVPLAAPQNARVVTAPGILAGLGAQPRRGLTAEEAAEAAQRGGPVQCHDITTYPAVGLAGGACGGYGVLLDIRDVRNPRRLDAAADSNMAFWHSATFSNDGQRLLFSDEWGGGRGARCRAEDRYEWGANALFRIQNNRLVFQSYYKMPAPQTEFENCVAHNGSPIPIPGREVLVQGWYQGGVSIFDWTDPANPFEIAFFDRGPLNPNELESAGSWSTYWYNGYMYTSEIARGLDVHELVPSPFISQNEIDAARTVVFDEYNPQEQQRFVYPPSFPLVKAYLDQLERDNGLAANAIASARDQVARAERASGSQRATILGELASSLSSAASGARDAAKVRLAAQAATDLAAAN
jgi:hypothetical protein